MISLITQISSGKVKYSQSETIDVRIEVTNTLEKDITLTFPSSQQYDFLLKNKNGQEIVRWSNGKKFAMHINKMTLAPGKLLSFPDKVPLPMQKIQTGDYMLEGIITVSKIEFTPNDEQNIMLSIVTKTSDNATFIVPLTASIKLEIVDNTISTSFSGTGKTIDSALQNAIQKAIASNAYPDKIINYKVSLIKGTSGGIQGANEIEVTIDTKQ